MKYKWYADDTELFGTWGADIQDILVFGGILVSEDEESELFDHVQTVKTDHGLGRLPIKWNARDVEDFYDELNEENSFEYFLDHSDEIRRQIINESSSVEYIIILSCIKHHSGERETQIELKHDLQRFCFANGLQKLGLEIEDTPDATGCEVLLDWPSGSNSDPYDRAYANGYNHGMTRNEDEYLCGNLRDLNFSSSPRYLRSNYNPLMQFTDLVVGSIKETIKYNLNKNYVDLGLELTESLLPKFRGYPDNIIHYGFTISSSNDELEGLIETGINEMI